MNHILEANLVTNFAERFKLNEKIIVLVGGCFDLLHLGHITFLKKAKQKGDILVVLLESDQRIKKLKGDYRPVYNQKERALMLSELKSVDFVIKLPFFTADTQYDQLIQKIKPKIIATTKNDPGIIHKERNAKKIDARVEVVTNIIKNYSTTNLLKVLESEF